MQCLTYDISLGNHYGKRPCQSYAGCQVGQLMSSHVHLSCSQTITVVIDLGTMPFSNVVGMRTEWTCAHCGDMGHQR